MSKSLHFVAAGFRQRCSYFLARELNVVSVSAKLDLFNANHLKDDPRNPCDHAGMRMHHMGCAALLSATLAQLI